MPHPTLTWMAATHGLGNALGFALCSVLAWRGSRISPSRPHPSSRHPAVLVPGRPADPALATSVRTDPPLTRPALTGLEDRTS